MAALLVLLVLGTGYVLWRASTARRRGSRPAPPPRVVAPDDDADFLRDLDRRTRRGDDEPLI